jgi:hypothetical protein
MHGRHRDLRPTPDEREDKSAEQVVLAVPDPEAKRSVAKPRAAPGRVSRPAGRGEPCF